MYNEEAEVHELLEEVYMNPQIYLGKLFLKMCILFKDIEYLAPIFDHISIPCLLLFRWIAHGNLIYLYNISNNNNDNNNNIKQNLMLHINCSWVPSDKQIDEGHTIRYVSLVKNK